jgi:hypothetical protein
LSLTTKPVTARFAGTIHVSNDLDYDFRYDIGISEQFAAFRVGLARSITLCAQFYLCLLASLLSAMAGTAQGSLGETRKLWMMFAPEILTLFMAPLTSSLRLDLADGPGVQRLDTSHPHARLQPEQLANTQPDSVHVFFTSAIGSIFMRSSVVAAPYGGSCLFYW